jgi:hypothetical protein
MNLNLHVIMSALNSGERELRRVRGVLSNLELTISANDETIEQMMSDNEADALLDVMKWFAWEASAFELATADMLQTMQRSRERFISRGDAET